MSYRYRIQQVNFSDQTTVEFPALTVIVGPNNSGKSRALKDILELTCTPNGMGLVVQKIPQQPPLTAKELNDTYELTSHDDQNGNTTFQWLDACLDRGRGAGFGRYQKWPQEFDENIKNSFPYFAAQLTAFLKTSTRLSMLAESDSSAAKTSVANLLQALYVAGREQELRIRELVRTAFPEVEVALDFTMPRKLKMRVGKDFNKLPVDPREALPILEKCEMLDDQGDGLRSYVGMVVALEALKRAVFLIDEPEAFLHPPQAFRIGEYIAQKAGTEKQIIVATHSADVLRGIIFNSPDAQIIRIDREGSTNTVRVFGKSELNTLIKDPLLSAAGVLDGLFYSGVVVTEAESDSRFFQAVSNKLKPTLDLHFVNADNKQTVPKVLAPYKRLGVRCVGIVDIDVLNDSGEFRKQLEAAGIAGAELQQALDAQKAIQAEVDAIPSADLLQLAAKKTDAMHTSIKDALVGPPEAYEKVLGQIRRDAERLKAETSAWQKIKKEGANALQKSRPDFDRLYTLCSSVGLFINPCGELEASLHDSGIEWTADKRAWIAKALHLVQDLTPNPSKQPWKFISEVHEYLEKLKSTP